MVRPGSLVRHADGVTIDFVVTDDTPHVINVTFSGITPSLFREGSGVIAEGRFRADGRFMATEILAKHDENYVPPVMRQARGQHETDTLK
jgi:cytochrome c-type biogenesis protein CcmE